MLYLLVAFHNVYLPSNEVAFAMFVTVTVYTMLPLSRLLSILAGIFSCLPHIVVSAALSKGTWQDKVLQVSSLFIVCVGIELGISLGYIIQIIHGLRGNGAS